MEEAGDPGNETMWLQNQQRDNPVTSFLLRLNRMFVLNNLFSPQNSRKISPFSEQEGRTSPAHGEGGHQGEGEVLGKESRRMNMVQKT
jgi:hypothetical protein